MLNDVKRLNGILREGKCCAEALVQVALEAKGQHNDQLLQAMRGLCGGVHGGHLCGALTGAACALNVLDPEHANDFLVPELSAWFVQVMGERYGGPNCAEILAGDARNQPLRCPVVVEATFMQMNALLEDHGYTLE